MLLLLRRDLDDSFTSHVVSLLRPQFYAPGVCLAALLALHRVINCPSIC